MARHDNSEQRSLCLVLVVFSDIIVQVRLLFIFSLTADGTFSLGSTEPPLKKHCHIVS